MSGFVAWKALEGANSLMRRDLAKIDKMLTILPYDFSMCHVSNIRFVSQLPDV